MDKDLKLWNEAAKFHGHICGGLTIGYRAALYAAELLELNFSEDEETVCISENDACGVDAIQVILGCSAGKGNLIIKIKGKNAYSFFNRKNGKSVRLILNDVKPKTDGSDQSREAARVYMFNLPADELFTITPVTEKLPEFARNFDNVKCDGCSEMTAEFAIRLCNAKKLCPDCYKPYDRFS